jgi:hypothetical protein
MTEVLLQRNVQFIYEHALACLELRDGFGATEVEVDSTDPRKLSVQGNGAIKRLVAKSAYAGSVNGRSTVYDQLTKPRYQGGEFNRTRSVNQYLTHWIYPYKGKFHPQMIRAFLNIAGLKKGDVVLDPFLGSGTTAVEAMLLGIDAIGLDVSPLCVLLTRVKTTAWEQADQIQAIVGRLLENDAIEPKAVDPSDHESRVKDFLEVAKMVTHSDVSVRKKDPEKSFRINLARMAESVAAMKKAKDKFGLEFGTVKAVRGDIRQMQQFGVATESVDAIITSPPYSIALDYVKNDKHALSALGEDVREIREEFIGLRGRGATRRLDNYNEDMKVAFREMARVLRIGAPLIMVIGDATVGGRERTTTSEMVAWGEAEGLTLEREMPKIVFGLYNVMSDEKVLFFRRS